jgi:hypothetical protein
MKSLTKPGIEIHLILDVREASILKSMVQNPISEWEPPELEKFRRDVFEACKKLVSDGDSFYHYLEDDIPF